MIYATTYKQRQLKPHPPPQQPHKAGTVLLGRPVCCFQSNEISVINQITSITYWYQYLTVLQFFSAGVKIIAVAVGRDIDVNALGKLTKSTDDLIIPKTGAALAEAAIATAALTKACAFVEKSTFFMLSFSCFIYELKRLQ